jgi:hypothetical protein
MSADHRRAIPKQARIHLGGAEAQTETYALGMDLNKFA